MQLKRKAKLTDHQACSLSQYINVVTNTFYNEKLFYQTALKNYKCQQFSVIHTLSRHRILARKPLVQETLNTDMEFRYQIIVPAIKIRKHSAKFMIQIALLKVFLCKSLLRVLKSST